MKKSAIALIVLTILLFLGFGVFYFSSPSVQALLGEIKSLFLQYPVECTLLLLLVIVVVFATSLVIKAFTSGSNKK